MEKLIHFQNIETNDLSKANVVLCGLPFDNNVSIGKGASFTPNKIRELVNMYPSLNQDGDIIDKIKLFDYGNISSFENIYEESSKIINLNKFPIFIGGDHSVSIFTQRAFFDYATKNGFIPTIIHLDAHPDICDIYEDNYYSHACVNKRSLDYGYEDENLVMIGIRCFENQEVKFLKEHSLIKCYKTKDVINLGISNIINELKNKFDDRHLIYLSYDIDINDPSFAIGTGTIEPWGLSSFTVLDLIINIFKELNVGCFDIVEVSPPLDHNDMTTSLAIKTLFEVLYLIQEKKELSIR